jgi:hypothetical protein
MTVTFYTSANLAYLPQSLVLLESLRASNPGRRLVLVLVDELPDDEVTLGLLGSFDEVIVARDLFGPTFAQWIFGHDVVEACTAVKGRALQVLLDRGDVVYLDPDMAVFGSLDEFLVELEGASILLTPHLMTPEPPDSLLVNDELASLRHGAYNFGMFGVTSTPEGRAFADWWTARLEHWCIDDVANGLFTDQRWGDLVPSLFPSAAICRHPGVNVASWNLHQRPFTMSPVGDHLVDGRPLVSYHFTKARHVGLRVSRSKMDANPLAADLWRWYLERLEFHTEAVPARRWAYADHADGIAIVRDRRRLFRSRRGVPGLPVDPFVLRSDDRWWEEAT